MPLVTNTNGSSGPTMQVNVFDERKRAITVNVTIGWDPSSLTALEGEPPPSHFDPVAGTASWFDVEVPQGGFASFTVTFEPPVGPNNTAVYVAAGGSPPSVQPGSYEVTELPESPE
jgi:hypothetical protein